MNTGACLEFTEAVDARDVWRLVNRAARVVAHEAPDALQSILGLGCVGQVTFSRLSETACIYRLPAGFAISFNPQFMQEELRNDLNFAYVLCHELAHLCLGHLEPDDWRRSVSRSDSYGQWLHQVRLVACEMQVSRFLHQIWEKTPDIEYRRIGESLVGALSTTPEVLLNEKWQIGDPLGLPLLRAVFSQRMAIHSEKDARDVAGLASVYQQVWDTPSLDLKSLIKALAPLLPRQQVGNELRLDEFHMDEVDVGMGEHAQPGWELVKNGEVWREQGRGLFETGHDGSCGAGYSDLLFEEDIPHLRDPVVYRRILAALRGFLDERVVPLSSANPLKNDEKSPIAGMIGRREMFWLSAGLLPSLYPRTSESHLPVPVPLRIYVDVSGSTQDYWRTCMDALLDALSTRVLELFQFSNKVESVTVERARRVVKTTGGTDFDCVLHHLLAKPPAMGMPILLLTDGFAGLDPVLARRAKLAGMRLVLILLRGLHNPERSASKISVESGREYRALNRVFGGLLTEADCLTV